MSLVITVYKESGKWYTSWVVDSDTNYDLWDERFTAFIRDHLPANIGEGFVVVEDTPNSDVGFHRRLFRYSDLF